MALVKRQNKNSRSTAISIAIALVLIVGFFLWQQLKVPGTPSRQIVPHSGQPVVTSFNESVFLDPRYLQLKDFSSPVSATVGEAGQPNPFQ